MKEGTFGSELMGEAAEHRILIFTYGTLKRGFPNHDLLSSLLTSDAAALVSARCSTADPHPLVVGPNGIPFLINLPGAGSRVSGELYSVSSSAGLARIDDLEGVDRGHYERLPVKVVCEEDGAEVGAMAYFAHGGFGERMWRRCGGAMAEYAAADAAGYVPPGDRRSGATFLGEVRRFLGEED